jgi:hypothetical protein
MLELLCVMVRVRSSLELQANVLMYIVQSHDRSQV